MTLGALPACPEPSSAGTEPVAGAGAGASLPALAWYRRDGVLDPGGSLVGWELTAQASGATIRVALPPEAAARGPVGGRVVVASDDGTRSEIRLVAPRGQCAALVHASRDVIRQAIATPAGDVVFHVVGRRDRSDRGVWRLPSGSNAAPRPVLPPLAPGDRFLSDIGRVWTTELRASHDGELLAVASCGELACRTRLARIGDRRQQLTIREVGGHVVGLDDRQLVRLEACDGQRCDVVGTDLASGRDRRLAQGISDATTVVVDNRLLAVTSTPGSAVAIVDPATGSTWTEPDGRSESASRLTPPAGLRRLLPWGGDADAGSEVPPGTVAATAATPGEPGNPITLIDVAGLVSGHAMGFGR
jgi:hypothetical protein